MTATDKNAWQYLHNCLLQLNHKKNSNDLLAEKDWQQNEVLARLRKNRFQYLIRRYKRNMSHLVMYNNIAVSNKKTRFKT